VEFHGLCWRSVTDYHGAISLVIAEEFDECELLPDSSN